LFSGHDVSLYALALACTTAVPVACNAVLLWPEIRRNLHIDLHLWRVIAVGGLPFMVWSALLLIYASVDVPMLQAMAGDDAVGWYSVAYRWVGIPVFVSTIVVTAFLPSLSAQGAKMTEQFAALANRALRLVFFVSAPLAMGIAVV